MIQTKCSLYKAFKNSCDLNPKSNSFIYMHKKYKREKVLKYINQYAKVLLDIGVKNNEAVTICLPNIPQAIYLFYGVNQIGGICNIVHPLMKLEQLKQVLKKTHSKILFCLDINYSQFKSLIDEGIKIYICSPCDGLPLYKRIGYNIINKDKLKYIDKHAIKIEKLLNDRLTEYNDEYLKDSIYLHSGGTTGQPKTIKLSSYSLNYLCSNANYILNEHDIVNHGMLAVLPMFHGFGLAMGIHILQINSATSVLMPKFNVKDTIKYISKGQINYIIGVPILYEKLLNNKDFTGKKLQNLKVCFVGGDNVTSSLLNRFNQRLKENGSTGVLFQGYGLTELITVTNVNIFTYNKEESVGKPLPGIYEKIIDIETNQECKPNELGEIYITGETIMNGYLDDDIAGFSIDNDGKKWIKTGDYGYIDQDGFLYFKQRLKRIIKVSGVNVFPSEVEDIIAIDFNVKEVACVGKEDKKHGHILDIYIVGKENEFDCNKIKEDIKQKCGIYAVPDKIHFVDYIPKTPIGKIDYNKLKD